MGLSRNVRMLVAIVRELDTKETTFYQLPHTVMTYAKMLRPPPADWVLTQVNNLIGKL